MLKNAMMKNIEFKPITFHSKKIIEPILKNNNQNCLSPYTFASLFSWSPIYQNKWSLLSDKTLLLTTNPNNDNKIHLLEPKGKFSKYIQKCLLKYIYDTPYKMSIYAVSQRFLDMYPEFSSHFDIKYMRRMANYVYMSSDLANLPGRKFQPKRNLINQFENNYEYTIKDISKENINDCLRILKKTEKFKPPESDINLSNERKMIDILFKNFEALDQKGLIIYTGKDPVAFSIYEELNSQVAVVKIEKALREYKGLYQIINRETAKTILSSGYNFINREEDMNVTGLRQAKLSYNPVSLCPSYLLTRK